MSKRQLSPENTYLLPFEQGTRKLSLVTLNEHSAHRRPKATYLYADRRIISYQNEILTIGVTVERDGEEEKVYLKALQTHLQVSCSLDTTAQYLSFHAYCCLERMMSYDGFADFKAYYWPDFFHPNTGKSKFLTIVNDIMGLDIALKPHYGHFYKPGAFLLQDIQAQSLPLSYQCAGKIEHLQLNEDVLSFFVVKRYQLFKKNISLPFLLAYEGDLKRIKVRLNSIIG